MGGDERVPRELVANCGADRAGAAAVDHAELVTSGEGGRIDEAPHGLACLLRRPSPQVELRRRMAVQEGLGTGYGSAVKIVG